ncbi:MAG: hypothetical protein NC250_00980 [Alistipes senegalensis]|nr:hypothetical protein [Bacteroides cellulosilyticus]MCM1351294.1 hypothetical protein [Alistipes senegalensis]
MKRTFDAAIRITVSAKEQLSAIAERKRTSLGDAASRIILYHAKHRIDYDETAPDSKVLMDMLRSIHVCVTKNSGSAERTESFIKTLLHQDGAPASAGHDGTFDDASHSVPADSPQFSALSALLERLLSNATSAKSFDGTPVMQIRLPIDEFARIRQQYDDLCTSRNS